MVVRILYVLCTRGFTCLVSFEINLRARFCELQTPGLMTDVQTRYEVSEFVHLVHSPWSIFSQ